jgi:hypothetical protein
MLELLKNRKIIDDLSSGARQAIRDKAAKHGITLEYCLQEIKKEATA